MTKSEFIAGELWTLAWAASVQRAKVYRPGMKANSKDVKTFRRDVATYVATNLLPMYKPKVKANGAAAVGNYAIQVEFSDGHATGIYSFDALREMCPCEACERDFRSAEAAQR